MSTNQKGVPESNSQDEALFPLQFLNRIISLLWFVIGVPLFVWVVLAVISFGVTLSPALSPSNVYGDGQSATPQANTAQSAALKDAVDFVKQLSPFSSDFAKQLWTFLAPILSIIVIVVLIRWVLFSGSSNPTTKRLGGMLRDVPSLIAVVVIVTLCLLPLLSAEIPAALSNIALVIVGFYFGTERRLKTDKNDAEQNRPGEESPNQGAG